MDGAAAAQIAAHHTRDSKELLSQEKVLWHRELAAQYGHQAYRVVLQAREHGQYRMREREMQRALSSVELRNEPPWTSAE